jgi:hypothetical protein
MKKDCMNTNTYLTEKKKICDGHDACQTCPLGYALNGMNCNCDDFELANPQKAIKIVQKWSDEPKETNWDKFSQIIEETFGIEVAKERCTIKCPLSALTSTSICEDNCDNCKKWWAEDYEKPKGENF